MPWQDSVLEIDELCLHFPWECKTSSQLVCVCSVLLVALSFDTVILGIPCTKCAYAPFCCDGMDGLCTPGDEFDSTNYSQELYGQKLGKLLPCSRLTLLGILTCRCLCFQRLESQSTTNAFECLIQNKAGRWLSPRSALQSCTFTSSLVQVFS